MKVIVIERFGDKDNFTIKYEVGKEYEFEDERAKSLIERKLVKAVEEVDSEKDNLPLTDIDMSGPAKTITADVKSFLDIEKLKGYLEDENESEKPRASVVKALEERIIEIQKS